MADTPDYELLKPPDEPPRQAPPRRPAGLWMVVAGLIAATAIAAYVAFGGRQTSAPATTEPERVETLPQPVQPLGGDAAPIVLPPLDQTDPVVRDLLKQITPHPRVAAWLATEGLIRNFVVVVSIIAEGRTPAGQVRVLRPSSGFHVVERGGDLYIDPRSYERYDGLAAAAASIDPAGAARLYATLKPRIEEASRDLGLPDMPFDRTLERAIVLLLKTPIVDDPVRAEPQGGVGYGFAAPDVEVLPAAQKQLLRMGPRNVRTIRSSLRAIALALGIPAERLPAPRT
ncbi:MAG: hypothetical protein A3H97_07260 [Acidobacteria bacterium RIFCSPLOWO2_02_FULL_65_29]|nr:MAG: hypothetical protein A3H97_07260 [Acidobacteria bacterium RIFCSPLOWO2_02_FULL_65_29]